MTTSTGQREPSSAAHRMAAQIIAHGSKSFNLASRILPQQARRDASFVYAWCRYVDDAIDMAPPDARGPALVHVRSELAEIYRTEPLQNPLWEALREVVHRRRIPEAHFGTLLDGMQMDVDGTRYRTLEELRVYCHRVAGVVGWLMVSVLGISDQGALRPAAHLGIAMQLTNICRDVCEDWDNGRLYLPDELLERHGCIGLWDRLGQAIPDTAYAAIGKTMSELLGEADRLYASSDAGLAALGMRSAFAVRAARQFYAAIGNRVRKQDCDPRKGRAIVPPAEKLRLLFGATVTTLGELPVRLRNPRNEVELQRVPKYPDDLLPF